VGAAGARRRSPVSPADLTPPRRLARPLFPPPSPPRSKDTLLLDLHPNAKMILGTRNIAFMHGPEHKALRRWGGA
jgi:hypothetical protein